ncbi:MAG: hypothetical protein FWD39_02140 [Clostridiales bacterium]|nr:hypothetical protein [Clostridiales bacterium]
MEFNFEYLSLLVIGLVEVAKRGGLGSRFLPLLAVLLGVGLGMLYGAVAEPSMPFKASLLGGLEVGLLACGIFSGLKASLGK